MPPPAVWGFTKQQAVKKPLTCWIVLADGEPPRNHELDLLTREPDFNLANMLLDLQPVTAEARNQIGDFNIPADRCKILEEIQLLVDQLSSAITTQAKD